MKGIIVLLTIISICVFSTIAFAEEDEAWYERVQVGGLIDGRIICYDRYVPDIEEVDEVRNSDVYLYDLSVILEADPADFVSGKIKLKYEQTPTSAVFNNPWEDDLFLDEGFLRFSLFWLYFQLGKFYLPFQGYSPLAVSDSMPYILGKLNKTAYEIGLDSDYFAVSFSGFNGEVDVDGDPERIDNWLVRLEARPLAFLPEYDLAIGAAYLNDATEMAYGIYDLFLDDPVTGVPNYEENVAAWSLFAKADFTFNEKFGMQALYEMVSTMQFDEENYLNTEGDKTNISALNAELAFVLFDTFWFGGKYDRIFGVDYLFTERYEVINQTTQLITDELQPLSYSRYGGFLGIGDKEKISAAIEYLRGTDNESHTTDSIILQFLVNF